MLRGRSRRIVVEPIKARSPKSKPSKSVEPDGRTQTPPDSAKPPAQTKQPT